MSLLTRALPALPLLAPAAALALPWTRVEEVPAADVYSLRLQDDTVLAGALDVVHVGASHGSVWSATAPVTTGSGGIEDAMFAGGALWAALYGQGVHRSTDGGATWTDVDAGLTGLGARHVVGLAVLGGRLHAGTGGAGVFVLDLAAPTAWAAFNDGIPVSVAGTVGALVLHGTTLLAPAGGNGFVYRRADGAPAWAEIAIVPPIAPGLVTTDGTSAGADVLLGTTSGTYRSTDDGLTWTAGSGLAAGSEIVVAAADAARFAAVNSLTNSHRLYRSTDGGLTWELRDEIPGAYVYALVAAGTNLFAARTDGLWSVPLASTPVRAAGWGRVKAGFRPRRPRLTRRAGPGGT